MKKLLLLLVFISCCMLPLRATAISDDSRMDVEQRVVEEHEEEGPSLDVTNPDVSGAQDESWVEQEEAEEAAAKLYTKEILTTGEVIKDIHSLKFEELDEGSFKEMQSEFLTYVQKVNWKTRLRLTPRDSNWLMRLSRYLCEGINYMYRITNPKNANLVANKLGKSIENFSRKRTCNGIMCLTIDELVRKIEVENPFILLAVDLETFQEAIRTEPKVAQLYKNMFQFFKVRATMKGGDYTENTKELVRISELGKGSYFETWKELARFAQDSQELDRKGQLNPQTEMVAQIKILEVSMFRIEDRIKLRKEVAKQLNKQLKKSPEFCLEVEKLKSNIQLPTLKQRARIYIKSSKPITPKIAAKLTLKYKIR